jgi:hypothetical protein
MPPVIVTGAEETVKLVGHISMPGCVAVTTS